MSKLTTYGITFKHDYSTITVECSWYELKNGFIHIFIDAHPMPNVIASYLADNVLWIVKQKEHSPEKCLPGY
jgi:hypothetical protein